MSTIIYDFQKDSNAADWQIVNDGVMGGMSQGKFKIDREGKGVFYGDVSTENNGGFSSIRHEFATLKVDTDSKVILTLKGDGKDYQFRIKDKLSNSHSYITTFSTTGEWQEIEIALADLQPSFRGQKLNMPNFDKTFFEEIRFLIGNKKDESFELVIDTIELR
ncbi:CIA30 family protein [Flavobacterium ardleyense]|uniref:CIA30 family protein n=1 Tax=Flavobacterium ardleyense TaxID=2038737 RepID=UPI00298BDB4B|nr:CIA30 family protein [Flavobacterium ardleyense]